MTMTNAEWCIINNIKFKNLGCETYLDARIDSVGYWDIDGNFYECYKGRRLGNSVAESILSWLDMEHVEQILDDAERRYLSAVIRPFRNQIISIYKEQFGFNHESIIIEYYDFDRSQSTLCLPQFEKCSMYTGMKTGWHYTLEELGL